MFNCFALNCDNFIVCIWINSALSIWFIHVLHFSVNRSAYSTDISVAMLHLPVMMEVLKLLLTVLVLCQAAQGKPYIRKAKVVKTENRSFYLYLPKEIFEHFSMTTWGWLTANDISFRIYLTEACIPFLFQFFYSSDILIFASLFSVHSQQMLLWIGVI